MTTDEKIQYLNDRIDIIYEARKELFKSDSPSRKEVNDAHFDLPSIHKEYKSFYLIDSQLDSLSEDTKTEMLKLGFRVIQMLEPCSV